MVKVDVFAAVGDRRCGKISERDSISVMNCARLVGAEVSSFAIVPLAAKCRSSASRDTPCVAALA